MAGNFLSTEWRGDTPTAVAGKVRGDARRAVAESQRIAVEAARIAAEEMRLGAPVGRTGRLHDNIDSDTVAHVEAGGAGGGATHVVHAGVRDFGEKYPFYVLGGTGTWIGRGAIYADNGNVMPMPGLAARSGKTKFAVHQAGQAPQRAWLDSAQIAADDYVAQAIDHLGIEHS
jgi:hypothetical protein